MEVAEMRELLNYLDQVTDSRQEKKVLHKMGDIIGLVFLATLAIANEWTSVEIFGKEHIAFLRQYIELRNGIPSHDTIQRVFAMIPPEYLQGFQVEWDKMLNSEEGERIKKILAIDGKTQCGNGRKGQKANHIVSAVDENGFCIGEKRVEEKTNEITAIPELLDTLNIKGKIITIDAVGTQTEIAKKIRAKRADYVLALKGNQGNLHGDVKLYFDDPELLAGCAYTKTKEKARGGVVTREYWQTGDIAWLGQRKDWAGLKSIAMTRNTTVRDGKETMETRYYISSLPPGVAEVARAIRGHWIVESYHWHLDVTFREDANQTMEKQAAFNLNIMRKLALNILRIYETGKKGMSLRMKRFSIGTNPEKHLENILSL
jgi:predicted transposase YbfD/YdcC